MEKHMHELEFAIKEQLQKTQSTGMLMGAQTICSVVLDKIYKFESSQGKKSANDYKRCLKEIKKFCNTGLSKKVQDEMLNKKEVM